MKKVAKKLQKAGRKGDTLLAHINPAEAALLDRVTDGGSRNPKTGLLEFWEANGPESDSSNPMGGDVGSTPAGPGGGGGAGGSGLGDFDGYSGMMGGTQVDMNPLGGDVTTSQVGSVPELGAFDGYSGMMGGTQVPGFNEGESPAPGGAGTLGNFGYSYAPAFDKTGALAGAKAGLGFGPLGAIIGGLLGGFSGGFSRGNGPEDPGSGLGMAGAFNGGGSPDGGIDRPDGIGGGTGGSGWLLGGGTGGLPTTPAVRARIARPTLTQKWGQPRGLLG